MIDRLFAATLTFTLLAGGTFAIGSEVFGRDPRVAAPAVREVRLQRVVVTATREAPVAHVASAQ